MRNASPVSDDTIALAVLQFFLEDSPRAQIGMGVLLLAAGLVIFPAMLSVMMPLVKWMNSPWAGAEWWQVGWKYTKGLIAFICSYFVLLGAGRLAIYSFVKAGLMRNPWT